MLIGAHVSTAGGFDQAIERGTERGCESIQIFNQSPRMWRPTKYGEEDFAAFREAMDDSPVEAVVIHAVYLINCATKDRSCARSRWPRSPTRCGSATGSAPPASSSIPGPRKASRIGPSIKRARQGDRGGAEETATPVRCCSSRPPATKGCSAATSTRPPS